MGEWLLSFKKFTFFVKKLLLDKPFRDEYTLVGFQKVHNGEGVFFQVYRIKYIGKKDLQ